MKAPLLLVRKGLVHAATLLLVLATPLAQGAPYAYVANNGSNTVSVIDTATNSVVATVTMGSAPSGVAVTPTAVAVAPDGSRVYVANASLLVIDTATDSVMATVPAGFGPDGVAVSPDGSRVYVANYCASSTNCTNGTVSVIDTATNSGVVTVAVGLWPAGVAVSPDGKRVYVANGCNLFSGSCGDSVSVIDTATNNVVATVPVGTFPEGVAVSPDGSRVYVANNQDGTVSVIDTATDSVVTTVPVGYAPGGVAVSPDGSRVYVSNICVSSTNCTNGTVSVIDTATNSGVVSLAAGGEPYGVAVSPDGSRIYVANFAGNNVSVIDAATGATVASPTVGTNPAPLGAFVGPGALIASNSSASSGAGAQVSGTVPALGNATLCVTTDVAVQRPGHGSVTLDAATGAYTYSPGSTTYSGPDAFTWSGQASLSCLAAYDPTLPVSNTAAVSLTINPLLTGLGDVTVGEGGSTQKAFSLTGSTPFTYTLASDNATVLPPAGVTVSPAACGTAGNLNCMLGLTAASVPGTSSVAVTAMDTYGDPVKKTVLVTVVAPPTVTGLAPLSVTAPASATASFAFTGTGALTLTATSSNTTLLPNSGITGASACTSAGTCSLGLAPVANQTGTTKVTVTVADGYGQSASGSFTLTVNKPAAPTLSGLSRVSITAGQSGAESFTDTGTGTLMVTATSSDTTLLPNSDITGQSFCTSAGGCTLTLQPASGQSGTATVTVTVADAYGQSATGSFDLTVQASSTGGGGTTGSSGGGASTPSGLLALALLLGLVARRRYMQQGRS